MVNADIAKEASEWLLKHWGEDGRKIIDACAQHEKFSGDFHKFLGICTAMGGNWGGMILSGIRRFAPDIWDLIPDDMGTGIDGFCGPMYVMYLLGVTPPPA